MSEIKTLELVARYDNDTKRTHRFLIESENGIAGSIYISKDTRPLPKDIAIRIKMKGDE
jgi:hypothetical protein